MARIRSGRSARTNSTASTLVDQHAFHGGPMSENDRQLVLTRFEFDRSLAAFDGAAPVGVAGAYSFQLSVPGQELLPAAGVTWVAVLPTYRRRGVLTQPDAPPAGRRPRPRRAARGALGVGGGDLLPVRLRPRQLASRLHFQARRRRAGRRRCRPTAACALRLADPAAALPELAKVYDTVLPSRPGLFARNDAWWQRVIYDPAEERQGASPLRCLLAEDGSGPRGYALYSGRGHPERQFLPDDLLTVRELMAADARGQRGALDRPAQPGPDQRVPRQHAPGR